jgi:hypothetical protein
MGMGGQCHAAAALPPEKETRYPLYGRVGGPPSEFDPRTIQLVASRCTGYAVPANFLVIDLVIYMGTL